VSIVWRLASGRYSPLDGDGARLAGGRWNSAGQLAVYASESVALCLAESLVHITGALPRGYVAFKIYVPDEAGSMHMLREKFSNCPCHLRHFLSQRSWPSDRTQ